MDSLEPKKILLFRIYQILVEYSDENHPLKQQDIINLLSSNYDIACERKAVGRNISFLKEAGVDIESGKNGSYLASREFETSEIRMLIDSVLCSKHINEKHSKDLIEKLIKLGGCYFKGHVKNIYSVKDWQKSTNLDFLLNIELVDEAIANDCQLSFDYNKFGIDKKLHKTAWHTVSPYQMILHNQHYYLMGQQMYWHNMGFYRLDKITNMRIMSDKPRANLRDIPGYENGINYRELSSSLPYMFTDRPQKIVLLCETNIVDEIIDWFGYDVVFAPRDDGKITATFTASECAMEYWCMQYGNYVEVLSPVSLRNTITYNLKETLKKYR